MAIEFKNLDLAADTGTTAVQIKGVDVHVLNHLPTADKVDFLDITFQNALEPNGELNEAKLNIFCHLNMVLLFADIEFSEEDRKDPYALYDILMTSGVLDAILDAIPSTEYEFLVKMLDAKADAYRETFNSFTGALDRFMNALPSQLQNFSKALGEIPADKLAEIQAAARQEAAKLQA